MGFLILRTLNFGLLPFHREDLLDDFFGTQVALEAVETAGAEFAAVSATNLGRNAERVSVAGFAIQGRVGRDQYAFDERMIGKTPKEFFGRIARALGADEFDGGESVMLLKLITERFGKVRHRRPVGDAMDVKPFKQLCDAISRLTPGLELRLKLVEGLGFDVNRLGFGVDHTVR